MRLLYTGLFWLLLPLILLRLYWRGFRAPAYRQRWRERLGIYTRPCPSGVFWFHAVSVGEAEAVFPIIRRMQSLYSGVDFLITTTTPTGSARVQAVLAETVAHVYLPYDLPCIISRFLDTFDPKLAVIMEKEIWPNLFAQCGARGIPLCIINARLSARSARSYQKIPALVIPALRQVRAIATQTEEDRRHFIEIGASADRIFVAGNLKYDVAIEAETISSGALLKRQLFPDRFVWIVASTHKGEDEIFMAIYRRLKPAMPELLLLVAPRHPERFQEVRRLSESQSLKTVMRSAGGDVSQRTDVYIADSIGELKMLYAAADIGFVAGSMVPVGGHNILEPLAIGLPVMFGPHMMNFKEIAEKVLAVEAALQCHDADGIAAAVLRLYQEPALRDRLSAHGRVFIAGNQGAADRIAGMLDKLIPVTKADDLADRPV